MSNKAKLILFLVFAALTFYQFYTYAKTFDLNALLPRDTSGPNIVYGIGYRDVAVSPSPARFDPSILLLALNIALWVEHPDRIKRAPLILAFIANLSIVIMSVGIAAPALKLAAAAPQNDIQTIWNLASLHAKWNAMYLLAATISGLIVLGVLVQYYATDQTFMSALNLRSKALGQIWKSTPIAAKATYLRLLIFAALTFYQLYMYATLVAFSPTAPLDISKLNLPKGPQDVAVDYGIPNFSFDPSLLLLALNILLWIKPPDRIGRRPLMLAFIANLAIVMIRIGIATPALQLAAAPEYYNIGAGNWEIQRLRTQWNTVYLVASTFSGLIVLGVLAHFYATDQASPAPFNLRSMASWQFWKTPPVAATIEYALLLVFGLLILYQFFTLASNYPFDQLFRQHTPVLIGTFITRSSATRFDPSVLLIALNIILLIKPINPSWRTPLVVIFIANLAVIGIQQGIIIPTIRQEVTPGNLTLEMFYSPLRWRFVRLLASAISALTMIRLLVQLIRKR